MVSYLPTDFMLKFHNVLILVVMEDGLVLNPNKKDNCEVCVLILVVMEDGLVLQINLLQWFALYVLILVVMEDGLVLTSSWFYH